MAECVDKNMIDKDEYPQTAELERRCVAILADLWHAPDADRGDRLLDDRLERGVHARRAGAEAALARPGMPDGTPTAEPGDGRERPGVLGEVLPLLGRRAAARADERRPVPPRRAPRRPPAATRTRSASSRSSARPSTAATSRSPRSRPRSTRSRPRRPGRADPRRRRVRRRWSRRSSTRTWTGTSGSTGSPRSTPPATSTAWSTRASAGCCGATRPRCPEELIFNVNYLGGNMPTFALNFSRPGAEVVAQYYTFFRLGRAGFRAVQQACRDVATYLAERDRARCPVPADLPRRRAAGVRLHHRRTTSPPGTSSRVARPARARLAGPGVHASRPTARTSRCCGSSAATASPATWPRRSCATSTRRSRSSTPRCTPRW